MTILGVVPYDTRYSHANWLSDSAKTFHFLSMSYRYVEVACFGQGILTHYY